VVSDGFTTIRAKFQKDAGLKLQKQAKIDHLSKLSNQAMLNIPKFRVMVAPSGPTDADRVQILIDYVGIVNTRSVETPGNPVHFHSRPGVAELLNQAEQLMYPLSEPEAQEIVPTPGRTRVMKNGQYTQEFATQIRPSLNGAGYEMLDGANLAPPVVPHRNDGSKVFGTRTFSRGNNQNPYDDLMQLLPGAVTKKQSASTMVSTTQPFASQPFSQNEPEFTRNDLSNRVQSDKDIGSSAIVDLTGSQSSRSTSPVGPQLEGDVENVIENMNNHSHGSPHCRAMDEHEMMSHVGRASILEPAIVQPKNQEKSNIPGTEDRDTSPPRTPGRREAPRTHLRKKGAQKCKPRSWAVSKLHSI
jgi:hypothetical protein